MMGMTLKVVRRFVASGELKTSKKNNTYAVSEEDLASFKQYIADNEHAKRVQELVDSFKKPKLEGDLFEGTTKEASKTKQKKYCI